MKLLIDENLSDKIAAQISDLFPNSFDARKCFDVRFNSDSKEKRERD